MEDKIKAALVNGPKTVNELVEITGKSETTVRKAVKALEASGAITKNDEGRWATVAVEVKQAHRGRPKDPFVQARDERVFEVIHRGGPPGLTKASIAHALEIKESDAYMSVWRLRKAGRIAKVLNGTRQPAYASTSLED